MKKNMMKRLGICLTIALAITLGGCKSAPKTMYQWEGYQPQVYQHFKGESPEQQITILEKDLEIIRSKGGTPPPGYHAHLGMLYSMIGKTDQMIDQFQIEKKLFPESSTYIDFLLKKVNKT